MALVSFKVGGVPEHFNYPWHLGIERGIFEKHGVRIEWSDQKGGTGAQIEALKSGELEIVTALTEGLIASMVKTETAAKQHHQEGDTGPHHPFKIIGTYVETPLCWAISTGPKSEFDKVEKLQDQKFGISRYGSGSQLMAYVLALENGWSVDKLGFVVENTFEGLRESVREGRSAAFLWETFTTKPFHDSGEVRRIGEISTLWPCFMIAANTQTIINKSSSLLKLLEALRESCALFHEEKEREMVMKGLVSRYGIVEKDLIEWMKRVKITASGKVEKENLERCLSILNQAKVVECPAHSFNYSILIDREFAHL